MIVRFFQNTTGMERVAITLASVGMLAPLVPWTML